MSKTLALLIAATSLCAVRLNAQTVNFQVYTVDPNPDTNGNDNLEKVVDYFVSTAMPSVVLGQGSVNGSPGGMYLYQSSGGVAGPWSKTTIAPTGDFYERAKAFKYPGDAYPGVIASVNSQLVWFQNPKNWGGDPLQPWPTFTINPNAGCHDLQIADVDGDGKPDVVCSATALKGTQSFIAFQNTYNNWTVRTNATPAGDGIDVISINGSPRNNVVACSGSSLYWYENPGMHGGNARTDTWNPHYIGGCDEGVSLAAGNFNGHDSVIVVSNEQTWTPGLVWYDPGSDPYSQWAYHPIDSTYQNVHAVTTGVVNGVPYFTVGEQEQDCTPYSGQPPIHPSLGCRVAVFVFENGGFIPTILSKNGTHNQATVPYNGGFLMAGANHHYYGVADPALYVWFVTIGASQGGGQGGAFQPGTYAITDSANWAIDGGFYHWTGTKVVEEWQQVSGNPYQQWTFAPSGSAFTICNVGDGGSICLSDQAGTLEIGAGTDTWAVTASGSGYTICNTRTGNYINDPAAQQGVVNTSATATVWSVHLPQ